MAARKPTETLPEGAPKPAKPPVKLPKQLGQCVDLYWELRQQRLELVRQVAELEEKEQFVKNHLIENIPKSSATGVAGVHCRVSIKQDFVPRVEDWSKFYDYVAKNKAKGSFALLNKAVNASAVKEIWEANKQIPGVGRFGIVKLSVNKI